MNILYIGAFSIKSIVAKYPEYGLDTYKTSDFLLCGFRKVDNVNLQVITAPEVGSYPKLPQVRFKRVEEEGVISIGFFNIKGIKQLMIVHRLYKEAVNIIGKNQGKTYVVFPYVMAHYMLISQKLKRKFGDKITICQIIPDIFIHTKKSSILYHFNKYAEKVAAQSDIFVLFTKAMAEYYGIDEKRYIVMESVIDGDTYSQQLDNKKPNKDKLRVVYTGALGKANGVGKLIEMMQLIKRDDFELLITGRGALSVEFEEAAKQDKRIIFKGTVPKEDVFKYQTEADILINPRSDNDAPIVTRYMFPSKLMEYMLTGNAVLTCRMSGIPEDYYQYVYVSEEDTPQGIATALDAMLNLTREERSDKGMKARQYILNNKTYTVQANRIIELMKKY